MAEIDFCRGMASKLWSPARNGMSPSAILPGKCGCAARVAAPALVVLPPRVEDEGRVQHCHLHHAADSLTGAAQSRQRADWPAELASEGAAEPASMVHGSHHLQAWMLMGKHST